MKDALQQLRDGELAGTRRFALATGLTEFPREIFTLADSLEILDLSGNALHSLPDDLHRLTRLRVLFCSNNAFTELPACIGGCAALEMVGFKANRIAHVPAASLPPLLRWLILTDNEIEELPDALGRRPYLQKLMLAGNRLQALPDTLAGCERLELLRIAANRFDTLPPWLASLPRLAWLAFGGNPMNAAREASALSAQELPVIDAACIALQEKLGEGASGVIHRALWQRGDGESAALAVKRFKGAITSDGTPRSEMAACIAAGTHAGFIGATARVVSDAGADALAMRLIDPAFKVLAGPPSLDFVHARCLRRCDPLHLAAGAADCIRHCGRRRATACARHPARRPVCAQHPAQRRRGAARRLRCGIVLRHWRQHFRIGTATHRGTRLRVPARRAGCAMRRLRFRGTGRSAIALPERDSRRTSDLHPDRHDARDLALTPAGLAGTLATPDAGAAH